MKTFILIYEECAQFEVVLTGLLMKSKSQIKTVGFNMNPITTAEGFQLVPHMSISDLKVEEIDLFVIPGGTPENVMGSKELQLVLSKLHEKQIVIAAICGGPIALAEAGLLNGKKCITNVHEEKPEPFHDAHIQHADVVVDGNIITAQGKAYAEFAIEIGKKMGIFENEQDMEDTYNFFKNRQD